jgi:hypothetical protein
MLQSIGERSSLSKLLLALPLKAPTVSVLRRKSGRSTSATSIKDRSSAAEPPGESQRVLPQAKRARAGSNFFVFSFKLKTTLSRRRVFQVV